MQIKNGLKRMLLQLSDKDLKERTSGKKSKFGRIVLVEGWIRILLFREEEGLYQVITNTEESPDYYNIDNIKPVSYQEIIDILHPKKSIADKLGDLPCSTWWKIVYRKLSEVFPDNEVEILSDVDFNVICKLGDVEITNSAELSHTMKGLYIRLTFNSRRKRLYSLEFLRTEATQAEINSEYLFSHSNRSGLGKWHSTLCKGNTLFAELYNDFECGNLINLYDLSQFFMLINDYFRWESLEGTPYRYMSNIKPSLPKKNLPSFRDIFEAFKPVITEVFPQLTYVIIPDNIFQVRLSQSSVKLIDTKLSEAYPHYCCMYDGDISYQSLEEASQVQNVGIFKYKGEDIPVRILPDPIEANLQTGIHRDLLRMVRDSINSKLTEQFNKVKWEQLIA